MFKKQHNIVAPVLTLIVVCLLALTGITCAIAYSSIYNESIKIMKQENISLVNKIDGWISSKGDLAENNATLLRNPDTSREYAKAYFTDLVNIYADVSDVYAGFADNTGIFGMGWEPDETWVATQRPWFLAAAGQPGQIVYPPPYYDMSLNQLAFAIVRTVNNNNADAGVVAVDIPLDTMVDYVEQANADSVSTSFLLDTNGDILMHPELAFAPNPDASFKNINTVESGKFMQMFELIKKDGFYTESGSIYISTPLATTGWYVVSVKPTSIIMDSVFSTLWQIIIAIAVIMLIIVPILFVLSNWINRKIYWYESILHAIPFVVSVIDNNMNFTFLNKVGLDFIGIPWKNLKGRSCTAWSEFCTACNTPKCGVECFKRGELVTEYTTPDGSISKVDIAALKNSSGKQVGYVEIDQDVTAMKTITANLKSVLKEIKSVSTEVTCGARQVADSSQQLSLDSAEQASSIERLSSSISDIAQKTRNNADMAGRAAVLANAIKDNAERGNHQMDEMIEAVKGINEASQNIQKVIKVIDDIAFQTNILALNAAVEAARAGQHGKGFAVVAEEVRNLASKSAEAAKNTGSMIQNSIEKADLGTRIAGETAASLVEIVSGINESSQIVSQIAQSNEEQSVGIEEINEGIVKVAGVVQHTNATAEQSAAASEEMSSQAKMLENLVLRFRG
ncbi:MAG: methyl-accepting chemotaxis protein [Oscillospiraceae bacterium]|jgi:methyl-accepting chemotaxis protein|nr:methyl-accepting chemotaxis protein [Oscillospiraceae bacterium]